MSYLKLCNCKLWFKYMWLLCIYQLHVSTVHTISQLFDMSVWHGPKIGRARLSWTTSKEYVTIKWAIKYSIIWAHKAWLKLMQLGTSAISAIWSHLLLITRIFQSQRWNLVIVNIILLLVAHEYKNLYINGTYAYTYIDTNICNFHLLSSLSFWLLMIISTH